MLHREGMLCDIIVSYARNQSRKEAVPGNPYQGATARPAADQEIIVHTTDLRCRLDLARRDAGANTKRMIGLPADPSPATKADTCKVLLCIHGQ